MTTSREEAAFMASLDVLLTGQRAPAWCYIPVLRGFVLGNALAAPLLALLWILL